MTCVAERMISACAPTTASSSCVEIELDVDLVAGGAQPVEAAFGDLFGDQDASHRRSIVTAAGRCDPHRLTHCVNVGR